MNQNELQRQALRWSEELRKAVNRGDHGDVIDVITSANTSVSGGDGLAVTAVLLGDLVQFVDECGIDDFVEDHYWETSSLLDEYEVFGRSGEFFSQVMTFVAETDPAQTSQVMTKFIEMSIIGAAIPSDDLRMSWSDDWAENVFVCILGRDVEGAVLATVDRGDLDRDTNMARLTQYVIEFLTDLSRHEVGLETLLRVEPATSGLVDAYSTYAGNSRFVAVRFELDELGPDKFGEVLMAAASALIVMIGNATSSEPAKVERPSSTSPWPPPQVKRSVDPAQSDLVGTDNQPVSDDRVQRVLTMRDGRRVAVAWSYERGCWLGDDGSEWVQPHNSPDTLMDRELWEMLNPGWRNLPAYIQPEPPSNKPPPPQEPDRRLWQPESAADHDEYQRLSKVLNKAFHSGGERRGDKLHDKADRIQLAHYQRTGRWLLGTPPRAGWYADPTGRFAFREWSDNNHWTERVQEGYGGPICIDPKFPSEADMVEYRKRLAEWSRET